MDASNNRFYRVKDDTEEIERQLKEAEWFRNRVDHLERAIAWIETYEPEIVSQARAKFGKLTP